MSRAGVFTAPLPDTGDFVIGRGEDCELRLDDTKASRRHAVLHFNEDHVLIEDFGSTNGTLVADRKLAPGDPVTIALGDMVTIGSTVLVLQSAKPEAPPARLWSQDTFLQKLEDERRRAARDGTRFAVVQVRIDGGAIADPTRSTSRKAAGGDVALAEALETALRQTLRPADVIASYATGAYEVLLPATRDDVADALAAQIRKRLEADGLHADVSVACYPRETAASAREAGGKLTEAPAPPEGGAMKRLEPIIARVAAGYINVLILGETGVGKEVLAQMIHARSPRAGGPMLCINCAALSPALAQGTCSRASPR